MRKRMTAFLLTAALALVPAAVLAAESETDELILATESAAENVLMSDDADVDALIEQLLPEGMTREEAEEDLRIITEVLVSEEFQELLQHVEVQELLKEVVSRTVTLAEEDPELVKQILETLGIKPGVIELLSLAIDNMDDIELMAEEFLNSEDGRQLVSTLKEVRGSEDYAQMIRELRKMLQERNRQGTDSGVESIAEDMESAAEAAESAAPEASA